jgi:Fe-S cluster assembly iron-binding protein IscA
MKGWHVRVRIEVFRDESGMPTAFKNRVDLDPDIYPEIDLIDESQGVPVVVDRRSADYLGGFVLDWGQGTDGRSGIKLEKPAK